MKADWLIFRLSISFFDSNIVDIAFTYATKIDLYSISIYYFSAKFNSFTPIFSLKSDALNKTHLLSGYNNYNIENLTDLVIF